jgi:hypothetical protein
MSGKRKKRSVEYDLANPLGCLSLNEFLCMLSLFFACLILYGSGNFFEQCL